MSVFCTYQTLELRWHTSASEGPLHKLVGLPCFRYWTLPRTQKYCWKSGALSAVTKRRQQVAPAEQSAFWGGDRNLHTYNSKGRGDSIHSSADLWRVTFGSAIVLLGAFKKAEKVFSTPTAVSGEFFSALNTEPPTPCGCPLGLQTGAYTHSFGKIEIFGLILISTALDFYSFGRLPANIYIYVT